jgi:hypothetical protein
VDPLWIELRRHIYIVVLCPAWEYKNEYIMRGKDRLGKKLQQKYRGQSEEVMCSDCLSGQDEIYCTLLVASVTAL